MDLKCDFAGQHFPFITYAKDASLPTRIVFVFIHYRRVETLIKTTSSLLGFIQPCDAIWIIDNGSSAAEQKIIDHHLSDYSSSYSSLSASYIKTNYTGNFAGEMAFYNLANSLYPHATHFIVVGDDDYILRELYSALPHALNPSDVYTWGFDYYVHQTGIRTSARDFTSRTYIYDSESCFKYWISQ